LNAQVGVVLVIAKPVVHDLPCDRNVTAPESNAAIVGLSGLGHIYVLFIYEMTVYENERYISDADRQPKNSKLTIPF